MEKEVEAKAHIKRKGWKMLFSGMCLTYFVYYLHSAHSFEIWAGAFMLLFWPIVYLIIGGINYISGGEGLEGESDFIDWWCNPDKYKFCDYMPYDPLSKGALIVSTDEKEKESPGPLGKYRLDPRGAPKTQKDKERK